MWKRSLQLSPTAFNTRRTTARCLSPASRNQRPCLVHLVQTGHWVDALRADVCVVDLNPRSLTAWILALVRRLLRRRTLAWGHLYPRAGANARSAPARAMLRRLTSGTILYGYDSVVPARFDLPKKPVWVAPEFTLSAVRAPDRDWRTDEDHLRRPTGIGEKRTDFDFRI